MKHIAALLFLLSTCCANAQSWRWGLRAGGSFDPSGNSYQWPEGIQDMVTDSRGNVYVVSHLISGAPGDATIRNTTVNTYNYGGASFANILVASFNCSGALRWSKVIGSVSDAQYASLAIDTLGNVYLAGGLSYVLTSWTPLPPRPRFDADTALPYDYYKNFFVVKYDSSGNFKWLAMPDADTTGYLQTYSSRALGLVVDAQNNLNVLAIMKPGKLANTGAANIVIPARGTYVLKFSPSGALTSAAVPDCSFTASGVVPSSTWPDMRIERAPNGDFLVAGRIEYNDFNNPVYDVRIDTHLYKTPLLLARFNSQWQTLWMSGLDGGGQIAGRPSFDAGGNIYVGGTAYKGYKLFGDSIIGTGTSGTLPFVAKFNSSGVKQWLSHASSTSAPGPPSNGYAATNSYGAALRPDGSVFTVGKCGPLYWGDKKVIGKSNDGYRAFTARLDGYTGNVLQIDTFKHWPQANQTGLSVAAGSGGDIFVGGQMDVRLYVGPDTLTSSGGRSDMFLAKYGYNCNCILPLVSYTKTQSPAARTVSVTYTGSTNGIDSLVWRWDDGTRTKVTGAYTTVQTHTYSPGTGSAFTVCVTAFSSCGQQGSCQPVGFANGVGGLSAFDGITLYPNPTTGLLTLEGVTPGSTYAVRNLLGAEMARGSIGSPIRQLSLGSLAAGTYLITITAPDGRRATTRVVRR